MAASGRKSSAMSTVLAIISEPLKSNLARCRYDRCHVAGVQRGGREEVKFEREARSLGCGMDPFPDTNDRASPRSPRTSHSNLISFLPSSPLYAGHTDYYDRRGVASM